MGNGYTFELETLIFWALCATAIEDAGRIPSTGVNLFVYGDDIIVPTEAVRNVVAVLRFMGFSLNEAKSFWEGSFRESCGGDFLNGEWVRPFYLKEIPREPHEYIAMANGLMRLGSPGGGTQSSTGGETPKPWTLRAWLRVIDALPSDIRRIRGPEELGDLVLWDRDHSRHTFRWRNSIRYYRVWRPSKWRRISWDRWNPDVVLASALYGTGDGSKGVMPRDAVLGYKKGWVPLS
jgi:hypothetical protein